MQPKRYHVIVDGTEFFLDVVQIGGTLPVPMIEKQENRQMWNMGTKRPMIKPIKRR